MARSVVALAATTVHLIWALGAMTVAEGILLAVSVAVFIYLGVAMFKPEWF